MRRGMRGLVGGLGVGGGWVGWEGGWERVTRVVGGKCSGGGRFILRMHRFAAAWVRVRAAFGDG